MIRVPAATRVVLLVGGRCSDGVRRSLVLEPRGFSCWLLITTMSAPPISQNTVFLALSVVFVALGVVERYLSILHRMVEIQQRLRDE